jgi:hypothetical protein
VYGRRAATGRTLTFGVSEWLQNNAQVLYDRETNSLWSHVTGVCLAGPLKGQILERFTAGTVTPRIAWAAWHALYPRTRVLSVDGREDSAFERYADYRRDPARAGCIRSFDRDRRLPAKTLVVGVAQNGGDAAAFPLGLLGRRSLVTGRWDDAPIVVLLDARSGATAVWKIPPGVSTLTRPGNVLAAPNGRRWHALTGRVLTGGRTKPATRTAHARLLVRLVRVSPANDAGTLTRLRLRIAFGALGERGPRLLVDRVRERGFVRFRSVQAEREVDRRQLAVFVDAVLDHVADEAPDVHRVLAELGARQVQLLGRQRTDQALPVFRFLGERVAQRGRSRGASGTSFDAWSHPARRCAAGRTPAIDSVGGRMRGVGAGGANVQSHFSSGIRRR